MGGSDLSYDTFDAGVAPVGTGTAGLPPRLCHWCASGDHDRCNGVSCWRCPRENHPRKPGVSGLSDGLAGGKT